MAEEEAKEDVDLGAKLEALVDEIKEVMERRKERIAELRAEIERREQDLWKLEETGTVGTMANALLEYLKDNGEFEDKTSEIQDVNDQIEDMRSEMENDPEVIANPNGERAQDYGQDLNNLEEVWDIENFKKKTNNSIFKI